MQSIQTFKNHIIKPPPSPGNQDTTRNQGKRGIVIVQQLVFFESQFVYRCWVANQEVLIGFKRGPNIEVSAQPGSKLHIPSTTRPKHLTRQLPLFWPCSLFCCSMYNILMLLHYGTYRKLACIDTVINCLYLNSWRTGKGYVITTNIPSRGPGRKQQLHKLWRESNGWWCFPIASW